MNEQLVAAAELSKGQICIAGPSGGGLCDSAEQMAAGIGSSDKAAACCRKMVCVSLFVAVLLFRSAAGSTCAQSVGE